MRYYMLNKPRGYLTAVTDERRPTVMELLPEHLREGLFPVGRLDLDTEGLLLLTDDGALCHRLLTPENKIEKSYLFISLGTVTEEQCESIGAGVKIYNSSDFVTAEAEICVLDHLLLSDVSAYLGAEDKKLLRRRSMKRVTVGIATVTEGKKHEVRRMIGSVGSRVLYLRRISMAGLVLDPDLPVGSVRPLTQGERSLLGVQ